MMILVIGRAQTISNSTLFTSSAVINETSASAVSADILQIITVPVWVVAVFVEPNWLQICWPQQSKELMCMAVPNHCTFLRSLLPFLLITTHTYTIYTTIYTTIILPFPLRVIRLIIVTNRLITLILRLIIVTNNK